MSEDEDEYATLLPPKKRGRPALFGEDLDKKLQFYVKKVTERGVVVTARIPARGILMA